MSRTATTCPGTRVACPSCGRPLPRVDVRDGHGFAVCPRRDCQRHFYWFCADRLCATYPVSPEEYRSLYDGQHARSEIMDALGIRAEAA